MAKITGRLLGLIDRLFHFGAGAQSAPIEYNTESPIQPVHELGRVAELQSGYGRLVAPGFWLLGTGNIHPAGGEVITSAYDPRTVIASATGIDGLPQPPLELDLWLLGVYAWSATNGILVGGGAVVSLVFPPLPGQTAQTQALVFNGAGRTGIADAAGTGVVDAAIQSTVVTMPLPLFVPIGTLVTTLTLAAAATPGTIQAVCSMWLGPKGARPPGLA